jgi:hypothetical protein
MSSKFAEFLNSEKIDPRRVLAASRHLERLRFEDRQIRLAVRTSKKGDAKPAESSDAEPKKRRSGRAVTPVLLASAQAGARLSGAQKTRLVRALNRVLEQKKKEPVDLRKVF